MARHPDRHYICLVCKTKYGFSDALVADSPFDESNLLRGCPSCRRVIDDGLNTTELMLVCSTADCKASPIGHDGECYYCAAHAPQ